MEHAGELEDVVPEEVKQSFWSLLGGAAWMVMTRGEIVVYISYLQRNQQAPQWKHIRQMNALVRWMKRKPSSLVCKQVQMPWQVTVFSDSAFKAQEPDCLTIRAAVILVTATTFFPTGGAAGVLNFTRESRQGSVDPLSVQSFQRWTMEYLTLW